MVEEKEATVVLLKMFDLHSTPRETSIIAVELA
jgi:hypothetical protein